MLHAVYFAPENLSDPIVSTDAGVALLIGVLRSLLQNCVLVAFADYRFDDSLAREVKELPDEVRKVVKSLLVQFKKRNRIVPVIDDDYSTQSDLALIAIQAHKVGLELVIVRGDQEWDQKCNQVARVTVLKFSSSDFESRRSDDVADRNLNDSEMTGDEFLDSYVVPFVRLAEELDIVDGSLGKNYREGYGHTLDQLFAAIRRSNVRYQNLKLRVHMIRGAGFKPEFVRAQIEELAAKHDLPVPELFDYPQSQEHPRFRHDRCLASEMGILNIGRGFDFIHETTDRIRNTTVGLSGPGIERLLKPYRQ